VAVGLWKGIGHAPHSSGSSDLGLIGDASIGKEWPVSNGWQLGIAGHVTDGSANGGGSDWSVDFVARR
jgi:hypothetical protein